MTAASPAVAPDWDRASTSLVAAALVLFGLPGGRMGESTSVEHAPHI